MLLLLVIAIVIILGYQLHFVLTYKHVGGDYAVGQAFVMFTLAQVVAAGMLIYFIIVCYKSSFQWLSPRQGTRALILTTFCMAMLLTLFFSFYFAIEWHGEKLPYFLKGIANSGGYFWIALCILIPFYFLRPASPPAQWVQNLIRFDMVICFIYTLGLGYGFLNKNGFLSSFKPNQKSEYVDSFQLKLLDDIKNYPSDKNIYGLMSPSNFMRPEVVREAALNKIKSRPNWENEILILLSDEDLYQYSYEFLSGNEVDHPELFKDAFSQSIKFLEKDAVDRIKNEMELNESSLDFMNIEAMLRSINTQFKDQAADFHPHIDQMLHSILTNIPKEQKKVKMNAVRAIEKWLRKNK